LAGVKAPALFWHLSKSLGQNRLSNNNFKEYIERRSRFPWDVGGYLPIFVDLISQPIRYLLFFLLRQSNEALAWGVLYLSKRNAR
jgi:hypothetical protein